MILHSNYSFTTSFDFELYTFLINLINFKLSIFRNIKLYSHVMYSYEEEN